MKTERRETESKMDIFYVAITLQSFSRRLRGHFSEQEWVWHCLSILRCSEPGAPEFLCIGLEWSPYAPFFLLQRHLLSFSGIPVPLGFCPSELRQQTLWVAYKGGCPSDPKNSMCWMERLLSWLPYALSKTSSLQCRQSWLTMCKDTLPDAFMAGGWDNVDGIKKKKNYQILCVLPRNWYKEETARP